MDAIYIAGTFDTKAEELLHLAELVKARHGDVVTLDLGTRKPGDAADIPAGRIAEHAPGGADAVFAAPDRGAAVAAMGQAFGAFMAGRGDVAGAIGIGGGGGTSMICTGLRELPLGVPKIMVSTLASGDVAPYVDISDITMMPAITDIAGLNRVSRMVLANAAAAIAGMAAAPHVADAGALPAVGVSMFGVTTDCVTRVAGALRESHEPMVFHATGTGGRVMEKLAASGMLSGLVDITLTEIADLLVGGVLPAAPNRLDVVARTGLPWVGSAGALDMVNFGPPDTVPERFRGRTFNQHNPQVTLMRTTAEECARIGDWIGAKLHACDGPVRLLLPEGGVSALDAPGAAFHDPEADAALFAAIEARVRRTEARRIERLPHHINDPAFAEAAVAAFHTIA